MQFIKRNMRNILPFVGLVVVIVVLAIISGGRIFGKAGEGFQRINVTCPRSVLDEALTRLESCLPV